MCLPTTDFGIDHTNIPAEVDVPNHGLHNNRNGLNTPVVRYALSDGERKERRFCARAGRATSLNSRACTAAPRGGGYVRGSDCEHSGAVVLPLG